MKRTSLIALALLILVNWLFSCDNSSTIGSSIVEDRITVTVDSSFTVTGETYKIEKIQSRTISQLIGRIDSKDFGRLSSDFVTQFMPASQLDTAHIEIENIDSLLLIMSVAKGEFVGDSVVPLGMNIYPLKRLLPSPIYSDFDPEDYYSPDDLMATKVYNLSNNSAGFINKDGYSSIAVKLPLDFARKLYGEYEKNPATFSSPTAFAEFFPGFYIKNSFGSGRLARVTSTLMSMYYHYTYKNETTGRDTTVVRSGNYFAVTPEIITNNNISLDISPAIKNRISAGENIVMAPVGLEVKMRFPAPEIIAQYNANDNPVKVLNTLTFKIPGEAIVNDDDIPAPTYLLMVLSKNEDEFFAKNSLPDNVTSFYATYNTTTGMYDFGDMRQYLLDLMKKDSITEDDYTFTITPVSATFETSSNSSSYYGYYYGYGSTSQTLSMLTPYAAAPVMAKLDLEKAKIKLTFSTQTIGN